MKQADLNRAVAGVTGESVATIKRLGFLIADPLDVTDADFDDGPHVVDWDDLETRRHQEMLWSSSYEAATS